MYKRNSPHKEASMGWREMSNDLFLKTYVSSGFLSLSLCLLICLYWFGFVGLFIFIFIFLRLSIHSNFGFSGFIFLSL